MGMYQSKQATSIHSYGTWHNLKVYMCKKGGLATIASMSRMITLYIHWVEDLGGSVVRTRIATRHSTDPHTGRGCPRCRTGKLNLWGSHFKDPELDNDELLLHRTRHYDRFYSTSHRAAVGEIWRVCFSVLVISPVSVQLTLAS